jgi:hypothetical protein
MEEGSNCGGQYRVGNNGMEAKTKTRNTLTGFTGWKGNGPGFLTRNARKDTENTEKNIKFEKIEDSRFSRSNPSLREKSVCS